MKVLLLAVSCMLLTSCKPANKADNKEYITINIDKKMLPVRIIPERNLEVVIIDKNGKERSERDWFINGHN